MRGLAHAFASAGFAVELPLLPGHGTTVDDMITTGWDEWSAAAESAYVDLASRCERVVVAGLSMGGALTAWLASRHPEIAGIVAVNPVAAAATDPLREMFDELVATGATTIPGIGSDIADPEQSELAYTETPLGPIRSMFDALAQLQSAYADIRCPLLLMNAPQDHVVSPADSDHLAASVSGPVERIPLERSFHVATLDFDRELIETEAVAFARRVCAERVGGA